MGGPAECDLLSAPTLGLQTTPGSLRGEMTEPNAKRRVIVADDEHVIADTLAYILNKAGFEATPVYTGLEAVKLAQDIKPDLLITDVIMPDMNGIEAAIHIRGLLPACKVLLFSGQAATAD